MEEKTVLAALAYQTQGEGWRLGTEADVNLHIQHWASGACVHRSLCVRGGEEVMGVMKGGAGLDGGEWNEGGIPITAAGPATLTPHQAKSLR